MFIINPIDFADANTDNLIDFIDWWSQHTPLSPKIYGQEERVDYFIEINIGQDLTDKNVRRLLRWKSVQHLTHVNQNGEPNPKVTAVLQIIDNINAFRREEINEAALHESINPVFQTGAVYRAFLFHIARPHEFPIWDRHVMRGHSLITGEPNIDNWNRYLVYKEWFCQRMLQMGVAKENLIAAKSLDDALVAFGQFLAKYNHQ